MPIESIQEQRMNDLREVQHCPQCGEPVIAMPLLRCAHCGDQFIPRSFTYKVRGGYIAECIDLDILSQGSTKEEAISRLQEAVAGYLEVAFEGNTSKGLVPRRAPLAHRLRYWAHVAYMRLRGSKHLMPQRSESSSLKVSHC